MRNILIVLVALVVSLVPQVGYVHASSTPPTTVTAIDIALEPDATMLQHAAALNARLRQSFPKGYALNASHRPHVTMLQRYVRTADLPRVYAAVEKIMSAKSPARWKLQAFKIDHAVWSGLALTVILAKPPAYGMGRYTLAHGV